LANAGKKVWNGLRVFLVKVIQRIGKEILLCIIKLIQGKKMNALDLISGMSIQSHS